ncbi:hypothetical protein [Paractinoplanes durhamensis]|uniref:Secreted protein n=1 Tax=Paractinoplanes durhamensis TaxID=113563 RepID=A0ABQ3YNN1_9ACTN|nr:hypothetical protein [Actinoplanes durhamensis]GID99175.1 hypothetical protein Adu01nite_05260 [Actinoplanes durhamensis]
MRNAFKRLATIAATTVALGVAATGWAYASPAHHGYGPVYIYESCNVVLSCDAGSANINYISGNHFNLAVQDARADGRSACINIYPNGSNTAIAYCDTNGSENTATHYDIYYNWDAASFCVSNLECKRMVWER